MVALLSGADDNVINNNTNYNHEFKDSSPPSPSFYHSNSFHQFSLLVDKIRSNDTSTEELYLDCSNLGITTDHFETKQDNNSISKNNTNIGKKRSFSTLSFARNTSKDHSKNLQQYDNNHCNNNKTSLYLAASLLKLHIRLLSLAMASNAEISSVHVDMEIFRLLMIDDEQQQKQQQQLSLCIVQFFISMGKIANLKHLDVYSSNSATNSINGKTGTTTTTTTTAPFKILWLTSALQQQNNNNNNLESLRLSRLSIVGNKVEFDKFERAMQVLGCSGKKSLKTVIFHLVSMNNTGGGGGGLDHLLQNALAKFPSESSLENIAIIANEQNDDDDEKENHNKSNKRRKIGAGGGRNSMVVVGRSTSYQKQQQLNNNDDHSDISSETIQLLCKIPNLKKLSLSGFALSAEKLIGVSHAIANPKSTLEYLDLSNNGLVDRDFLILGYAMELACKNGTTKFQGLNVSYNDLKHKTGAILAHVLTMDNTKLRILDVSHNNIGNDCEGCLGIGKSLFINETLEVLNLKNCFVEDDTIMGLASSILFGNTKLQSLNISNNLQIEQEFSYQILAEAIEQNHSITEISIEEVASSSSTYVSQIKNYCKRNKNKNDCDNANKVKSQKLDDPTTIIKDLKQDGFIDYKNKDCIMHHETFTPNLTTDNLRRCTSLSSFSDAQKVGLKSVAATWIENKEQFDQQHQKREDDRIRSLLHRCRSLPNINSLHKDGTTSIRDTPSASPQPNCFLVPSKPTTRGRREGRQGGLKRSHKSCTNLSYIDNPPPILSGAQEQQEQPKEQKKKSLYNKKGEICGVSFSASIARLTTVVHSQASQPYDREEEDNNGANFTWNMPSTASSTTNIGGNKMVNGINTASIFSSSVYKTSTPGLKSILSKNSLKSSGGLRDIAAGASNMTRNVSWCTNLNNKNNRIINNISNDNNRNGVFSSKQNQQMNLLLLNQQQKAAKKNMSMSRGNGRNNSNLKNALLANALKSSNLRHFAARNTES